MIKISINIDDPRWEKYKIDFAKIVNVTLSMALKHDKTEGIIKKDAFVRLLRDNVVIYDGKIGMLKREKNEAKEVGIGTEFGMSFDKYNDLREGDRVECYEVENIKATL